MGFDVSEHPFGYSKFPGAYATPLAGALVPVFAFGLVYARALPRAAVVGMAVAALVVALALRYLGGRGVLTLPFARRRGVNLEAVRGGAAPTVWLVAHIDSKWQPVSMITRVLGIVTSAIGLLALAVLAVVRDEPAGILSLGLLALTCVGAVPLMLSYVGDRNHGTLDNASGVAAVLDAATTLAPTMAIGVLISDAEELALAGASAWAAGRTPGIALN